MKFEILPLYRSRMTTRSGGCYRLQRHNFSSLFARDPGRWDEDVGGLCSINKGRIQGCRVAGTVKGKWTIGGICSDNQGGILVDCEVDIRAYASEDVAGGICGYNHEGTLRGCQAHVLVCSPINAGGLCGFNSGRIEACWVKGEVVSVSWGDDEPAASPSYYSVGSAVPTGDT